MKLYDSLLEISILQTLCESEHSNIILSQIAADWFTSSVTQEIFNRILFILEAGKKIPPLNIFVCDQSLSDAARAALSNSNNVMYKDSDIRSALDIMRQYRTKKIIAETCMNCLEKLNADKPNTANVLTQLENALQKCYAGNSNQDDVRDFKAENADKLVKEAEVKLSTSNENEIIPSGFYEFDKRTGGLRRGNVLVLASVPGGGKSAMALQMAIHQYVMGFNVCFVSYEMDPDELEYRLYANISKINHGEINLKRLSKQKKEIILTRYREWLESSNHKNEIRIWSPKRELTIPQITMEIKSKNYDVVYIDYLSLLYQNPKKQVWENLGDHTRAAKLAGSALNAAFVVLAQYDDESNKIKYSKQITANANFVWAWEYGDKEKETGIIEVKQLKARNAGTYPFYLDTYYSIFTFRDYRGPVPDFKDDDKDDGGKEEIRRRKKVLDNKMIAQKVENAKVGTDSKKIPETDRRGIPKMPQLL